MWQLNFEFNLMHLKYVSVLHYIKLRTFESRVNHAAYLYLYLYTHWGAFDVVTGKLGDPEARRRDFSQHSSNPSIRSDPWTGEASRAPKRGPWCNNNNKPHSGRPLDETRRQRATGHVEYIHRDRSSSPPASRARLWPQVVDSSIVSLCAVIFPRDI